MRSDYALYAVAIIFFVITLMVVFVQLELKELWIITTTVLGFLFIGLGYTQRPKPQVELPPPTTPTPTQAPEPIPPTETTTQKERKEIAVEVAPALTPPISELTKVKGIGAKRSEQLKALGINTLEDLAKASANDIASKLQISPKITGRWISEAKKLTGQS